MRNLNMQNETTSPWRSFLPVACWTRRLVSTLLALMVLACPCGAVTLLDVSTNADSGTSSLRGRISQANGIAGTVVITFSLPEGSLIAPVTALPAITGDNIYLVGDGKIRLSGQNLGADASGLQIDGGGCIVQGLTIIDFPADGIQITGSGNGVYACRIGTDGTSDLGNGHYGIRISGGENNTVGGPYDMGAGILDGRNIVAGNGYAGIAARNASHGTEILGNYIGTDVAGTTGIPNGKEGIYLENSFNCVVGGPAPGERNVISGNVDAGIEQFGSSAVIQGNYIGVDATGNTALANGAGIVMEGEWCNGSVVGGDTEGAGNAISGNLGRGIDTIGVDDLVVSGNYLGTNATGLAPIPNSATNIFVKRATNAQIGGTGGFEGNLVAASGEAGIVLDEVTSSTVQGNIIGAATGAPGTFGNTAAGIVLQAATTDITIGGEATGSPNVIAGNNSGIVADGADVLRITCSQNSIFGNTVSGIVLDNGANANVAPPIVTTLEPIQGTAPALATVEMFADSAGQGRLYIGTTTADGSGDFTLSADLTPYGGMNVTVTATDAAGNTSAFSTAVAIPGTGATHTADQDGNSIISLGELLRIIQFFNSGGFCCANDPGATEDGFLPGAGTNHACDAHACDYNPGGPSWSIDLTELLRLIQFFNSDGYHYCPAESTEDGYCPGL